MFDFLVLTGSDQLLFILKQYFSFQEVNGTEPSPSIRVLSA
jgi:hypothetical protein